MINKFEINLEKYNRIPGNNFVYWFNDTLINLFQSKKIANYCESKAGIVSGDDSYFLRLWFEINNRKINFSCEKYEYSKNQEWVPMNKGGSFRYYGDGEFIMRLYDLWTPGKTNVSVRRGDINSYYQEAITWNMVAGTSPSFRISKNRVFGVSSPAIFSNDEEMLVYLLGYLNSKISNMLNKALNPTVNMLTGNIMNLPINVNCKDAVIKNTKENIEVSKIDWDSFETSWDFKEHPLL